MDASTSQTASKLTTTTGTSSLASASTLVASQQTNRKSTLLNGLLVKPASFSRLKLWKKSGSNNVQEDVPADVPKKDKGPLGLGTLYDPPDDIVMAELIFIHGLGGSSIKTWTDSSGPANCWPRDWLPVDPDFKHVRVHSYGYEADWRHRTPSILSVHDFAESLLGEIRNHHLIKHSRASIIMIGHSMGGCVAKKTYILARQDSTCTDLASRFHSIFFLATPHRGSELGKVLRSLLLVAGVSKPYVKDLVANSAPVIEVNDVFGQFAADLRLWSFFETLPMSDYSDTLVVDKQSATLGYTNEQVSFMDADHRRICKFKSQSDHNYRKLRNALSSAISIIRESSPGIVAQSRLGPYLGVDDSFKDDLAMFHETKHPGTCVWVTEATSFSNWALRHPGPSPIYWLLGLPGVGKSIISSHVVDHLQSQSMHCSYLFIKNGKIGSQSLTPLLMSLAFQMALQDTSIMKKVLQLQDDNVSWTGQSDRYVWRKLFLEAIFETESLSTHFWVIDGLDEFFRTSDMLQIFEQLPSEVRVFITSRKTSEIENGTTSLGRRVFVRPINSEDTVADMRSVVEAGLSRLSHLRTNGIGPKIIEKSSGSFLWIRLVLKELETAFTDEDIEEVLDETPIDLSEMYARILKSIEKEKRRAKLAKSILAWVKLAVRPMTVEELRCAVHLDLKVSPHKMHHVIVGTCGQFLTIDQRERVDIVHKTARQFLFRQDLNSDLAVTPTKGHGRMAVLCLSYLSDNLRSDKMTSASAGISTFPYAADSFSQHLSKSDVEDSEPFYALKGFLDTTVLYWIENVARRRKLHHVFRAAIDLDSYAECSKHTRTNGDLELLNRWARDISRVSATFREPLLQCPSAIHKVLPAYCPPNSAINQSISSQKPSLAFVSQQHSGWNECLMSVQHEDIVMSITCGKNHLAVGLANGLVSIYNMVSLKNTTEFQYPALLLGFGCSDRYLAASGPQNALIWDVKSGTTLHRFTSERLSSFCFIEGVFMSFSFSHMIESRNLDTGEAKTLHWGDLGKGTHGGASLSMHIKRSVFDQAHAGRLGICFFDNSDIYILEVGRWAIAGICSHSANTTVTAFAFNPVPEKHSLAALYADGSLVVFDTRTMNQTVCDYLVKLDTRTMDQIYIRWDTDVYASAVMWTTDGKYLVAGTGKSPYMIEIYGLKSSGDAGLCLVHQVDHPGLPLSPLVLSNHGQRIISSHSVQTRIWEFPLMTQLETEGSSSIEIHRKPSSPGGPLGVPNFQLANISAMALSKNGQTIICGTEGGDIACFSAADGSQITILHRKHKLEITTLELCEGKETDWIVTIDLGGVVIIAEAVHNNRNWNSATVVLEKRPRKRAKSLLISPSKDRLLIVAGFTSELWEFPSGELVTSWDVPDSRELQLAQQHPSMDDRFIIFQRSFAHLFYWHNFERTPEEHLCLSRDGHLPSPEQAMTTSYLRNDQIFLEKLSSSNHGARVNCWNITSFRETSNTIEIAPRRGLQALSCVLGDIIAVIGSVLVFLDRDRWVCTADLDTMASTQYVNRHFFIFPEWLNPDGEVICVTTPMNDLIFASGRDITIVRGWMDVSEKFPLPDFDMDIEFELNELDEEWLTRFIWRSTRDS